MEERVKTNYDHPNALDHDLLCEQLEKLVQGESVEIPEYSYSEHTRTKETTLMTPKSDHFRGHLAINRASFT